MDRAWWDLWGGVDRGGGHVVWKEDYGGHYVAPSCVFLARLPPRYLGISQSQWLLYTSVRASQLSASRQETFLSDLAFWKHDPGHAFSLSPPLPLKSQYQWWRILDSGRNLPFRSRKVFISQRKKKLLRLITVASYQPTIFPEMRVGVWIDLAWRDWNT